MPRIVGIMDSFLIAKPAQNHRSEKILSSYFVNCVLDGIHKCPYSNYWYLRISPTNGIHDWGGAFLMPTEMPSLSQ